MYFDRKSLVYDVLGHEEKEREREKENASDWTQLAVNLPLATPARSRNSQFTGGEY